MKLKLTGKFNGYRNKVEIIALCIRDICSPLPGAPNELFCKNLFCSRYFAGKIDSLLCLAGKMKYIYWETNRKFLCEMVIISEKRGKFCFEHRKFSEILDVHDEMHIIHSCYAAGW